MTILTPSDEVFILFLIIVYFEDNADTDYVESYAGINFVSRSGWQEIGIHLWNTLYQRVKKDEIEHGECFDMEFQHYYTEAISTKKRLKEKRKRNQFFHQQ